jgi:hypothetical protein
LPLTSRSHTPSGAKQSASPLRGDPAELSRARSAESRCASTTNPRIKNIDVFCVFGGGLYAIYMPLEKTFFVLTAWLFLLRAHPGESARARITPQPAQMAPWQSGTRRKTVPNPGLAYGSYSHCAAKRITPSNHTQRSGRSSQGLVLRAPAWACHTS